MKNSIIILTMLSSLAASSFAAEKKHQLRQWQGKSGKPVIAKFISYTKGKISLQSASGKRVQFHLSKLSNQDKIYVRSITRDSKIKFTHPTLNDTERLLIPSLNQVNFGNTDSNCGPNAVANFLLWWDKEGVLPLPYKHKDLDDLADKLHKDLESAMRSKNGTSYGELAKGLDKFFIKKKIHHKYNRKVERLDPTIENLEKATKGDTMSVLSVQTLKNNRFDEGHYISVISCKDGIITFNTWGHKFTGKLKPGIMNKKKVIFIELVREPGSSIYHWVVENGGGFVIEAEDHLFTVSISKRTKKKAK